MGGEETEEKILDYYKSKDFLPKLPSYPSFRHYRGRDINNSWKKCPRKVSSPEQLKEWIIQEKLIDVYYSTAKWLDPRFIAQKNKTDILIGHDLVFDVDESFSSFGLKEALKNTKKIFGIASLN